MGEAKRRKKLDPTYGQAPLLSSDNQKKKHVNSIVETLSVEFEAEIKQIASSESIIAEYNQIKHRIAAWLNTRLQSYRSEDRSLIASSIMVCFAEIAQEYETSPLLIMCFFEILQPFLPEDKRSQIQKVVDRIEADLTPASL